MSDDVFHRFTPVFDGAAEQARVRTANMGSRDIDEASDPDQHPPVQPQTDLFTRILEHERPRWMLWSPVVFGLGSMAYFALSFEPAIAVAVAILVVALVLAALSRNAATPITVLALIFVLAASGFLAAKLRTIWVTAPVITADTPEIEARGFVELIEPRSKGGVRMTLRVTALGEMTEANRPVRIRVSSRAPLTQLRAGDAVIAWVKLRPPAQPASPGDYDFARYAYFKALGGVGFLTRPPVRFDIGTAPPMSIAVFSAIGKVRSWISKRISAVLPGQTGAIATALITGERGQITEETNEAYRAAGLYHVLSISGLHMAIMGGAVFFAMRFSLALFPSLALRFDIKKWAAVGALIGSFAYLLISGGAFATIRSFLMIAVMFIAILLDRPALALRNVAIAALLILVAFPESVLDPGFQMSFAAVIALIAGFGAYERRQRATPRDRSLIAQPVSLLGGIVISTLFASFAVAPLALYHFHQSQHLAVLANAVAMPVCNLIVMPMALAALVALPLGLEHAPLWLMGKGIDAMTQSANWVASMPYATGRFPAFPPSAILCFVAGALMLALIQHSVRWLGLALMAVSIGLAANPERPDILISQDGGTIAVRDDEGRLRFSTTRRNSYVEQRWLERDGDSRPSPAIRPNDGYRCDSLGCTIRASGRNIVISNTHRSLPEDCALADILIIRSRKSPGCKYQTKSSPSVIINRETLQQLGAHAMYFQPPHANSAETVVTGEREQSVKNSDGVIWQDTVAKRQGTRPWSHRTRSRLASES